MQLSLRVFVEHADSNVDDSAMVDAASEESDSKTSTVAQSAPANIAVEEETTTSMSPHVQDHTTPTKKKKKNGLSNVEHDDMDNSGVVEATPESDSQRSTETQTPEESTQESSQDIVLAGLPRDDIPEAEEVGGGMVP